MSWIVYHALTQATEGTFASRKEAEAHAERLGEEYQIAPVKQAEPTTNPVLLARRALWVAADEARNRRDWRTMRALAEKAADPFLSESEVTRDLINKGGAISQEESWEASRRVSDEMNAHERRMNMRRESMMRRRR